MRLLNAIHQYDMTLFFWLMGIRIHSTLVKVCRYISRTGDGDLYILLIVVLFWQTWHHYLFKAIVLAFCIERPLYFILKNCFKRNRPSSTLNNSKGFITPSDQFSFPSGHTSAAFMVATLLGTYWPFLLPSLLIWASAIGFSRVVLGVHFPTDIFVGCIMGVGIAYFSLGVLG